MAAKMRSLKIIVALTVAISFTIVLLAPSPVVPATACQAESGGVPLSQDFSVVPQPIIDDANEVAAELFGKNQEKSHDFVSQLLAIYLEAKDKDVVIFFNSGGFGWTPIEETPEGQGFATGIESELVALGYNSSLLLNYFRTAETLNGCLSEFMAEADLYPSKAKDLALRVEFLTDHIPGIRVILAGQSNGSSICERVMRILQENTQVYSIQLGPPFWNDTMELDRSLVLRSNGEIPDSFSHGDLITIIRANLGSIFGISEDNQGKILLYIGAPGHDYSWEYDGVRSQVTNFLGRWLEN